MDVRDVGAWFVFPAALFYLQTQLTSGKKRKCDESRPQCRQCRDQNVHCPGYRQQLRWSRKHEVFSGNSQAVVGNSLDANADATALESRASEAPLIGTVTASNAPASPSPRSVGASDHEEQHHDVVEEEEAIHTATPNPSWTETILDPQISLSMTENETGLSYPPPPNGPSIGPDPQRMSAHSTVPTGGSGSSRPQNQSMHTASTPHVDNSPDSLESPSRNAARCGKESEWNMFQDHESLVQYYFDNICYIHTTYDNPATPFRSVVGRRLASPLIFSCIASMCATHLFQGVEGMLPTCMQYHSSAIQALSSAIADLDQAIEAVESPDDVPKPENSYLRSQIEEALLASLLLGYSSVSLRFPVPITLLPSNRPLQPWLDASDLGLPHLLGARKLIEQWLKVLRNTHPGIPPATLVLRDADGSFLIGSMVYWEALLAFVIDQPLDAVDYLGPFQTNPERVVPNSTTGVSTPIYIYLAHTGIFLRQQRMLRQLQTFGWRTSIMYADMESKIAHRAADLYTGVMAYAAPSPDSVLGMETRPEVLHDMLCVGEIYRLAILLELSRVDGILLGSHAQQHLSDHASPGGSILRHAGGTESVLRSSSLVQAIISYLDEFPPNHESGMHQTLALIICGSALIHSPGERTKHPQPDVGTGIDGYLHAVTLRPAAIERHRTFIRERMALSTACFGLDDIFSRAERLLEQLWNESDEAAASSSPFQRHWIDVMQECKLETFLG